MSTSEPEQTCVLNFTQWSTDKRASKWLSMYWVDVVGEQYHGETVLPVMGSALDIATRRDPGALETMSNKTALTSPT